MRKFWGLILAFCMGLTCISPVQAEELDGYEKYTASPEKYAVARSDGSVATDGNVIYNLAVNQNNHGFYGFDIAPVKGYTVGKAEFVFTPGSYVGSDVLLYALTSAYDAWTGVPGGTAGHPEIVPDFAETPFAYGKGTAEMESRIDITDHVRELVKAGNTKLQFAAMTPDDGTVSLGNVWEDGRPRPKIEIYYAKAPEIIVTSPGSNTLDSGSSVEVALKAVDANGVASVKIFLDNIELEVTKDTDSYSAVSGVLEDGQHTIRIEATNALGITSMESMTILVGYQKTVTEINNIKCGSNNADLDTKWNMAVTGANYYYFAYDISALEDYTLDKAVFEFKPGQSDESLNFYEIITPVSEWGYKSDPALDYDPAFPADPAPNYSSTAFKSVKLDGTGTADITGFVEEKLAKGETIIQFAVNSNQYRVSLGSLSSSVPKLVLTTTDLLRPAIMPAADYSYVSPGNVELCFNIDGNGAEITEMAAEVDGEAKELVREDGAYVLSVNLSQGTHMVAVSAANSAGTKRIVFLTVRAIDYEITDQAVNCEYGLAKGSAIIHSYTGALDKAVVIIAVYGENNRLLSRSFMDYASLSQGETAVHASVEIPEGAVKAKMFIWYDVEGLLPLTGVTQAALQ